jgi:hypothetical protein
LHLSPKKRDDGKKIKLNNDKSSAKEKPMPTPKKKKSKANLLAGTILGATLLHTLCRPPTTSAPTSHRWRAQPGSAGSITYIDDQGRKVRQNYYKEWELVATTTGCDDNLRLGTYNVEEALRRADWPPTKLEQWRKRGHQHRFKAVEETEETAKTIVELLGSQHKDPFH